MSSPARLGATAAATMAAPSSRLFVSTVTVWEIAIKQALNRLAFPLDDFDAIIVRMGAEVLPILPRHAIAAGRLPLHHADPFDRMLVAQARTEALTLVSSDAAVAHYDVPILNPKMY